jgi:hypothetical protein
MKRMHVVGLTASSLLTIAMAATLAASGETPMGSGAQDEAQQAKHLAEVAVLRDPVSDEGAGQEAQQKVKLEFFAADAQVVKGKQYSADTSTETVQTLTDGNRIVHHTVSKFYRDSEGRTRREETFGNVDPGNPSPHEVKVFIDDPVSGTAYVLDPGSKSVESVKRSIKFLDERNADDDASRTMVKIVKDTEQTGPGAPGNMLIRLTDDHSGDPNTLVMHVTSDKREVVKEDLGARNIEGVDCNGTRQTITIPAGEVGNEKPISIVTETWFAPSIDAVVQSTTDDPRYGKTTYQLTNVQTSEPARALFEPPADFKLDVRK